MVYKVIEMKIRELIRKLESVAEIHGDINVGIPETEGRRYYMGVVNVQLNKNKYDVFNGFLIVEIEDKAIIVLS